MVLKQLEKAQQRKKHLDELQQLLQKTKEEKRSFTDEENQKFKTLTQTIETLDEEIAEIQSRGAAANGTTLQTGTEKRSLGALEVRGYRGKERIGKSNSNVQLGDLIYSHLTGKFRNEEVRAALSTTSGGLVIPKPVFDDFIDMVREMSFLNQCTVYPMASKTLSIPRVVGDILPHFKAENDPIIESNPLFGEALLEAKPLYALTSLSLELIESSSLDMGSVITQIMAASMANAMQAFLIQGGDPLGYAGIINDPAINTIAAADVNYASIGAAFKAAMNNFGRPDSLIINVNDVMNMELLTDTAGQYVTAPRFMDYLTPYPVVGNVPEGQAIVADLSTIAFGVLSEGGLQIELDKSGEAFQNAQVKVRARFNGDFVLTNPKMVSHILPTA
jgi:HK97 family phage major capsid protein